jgi:hypothetical protein
MNQLLIRLRLWLFSDYYALEIERDFWRMAYRELKSATDNAKEKG